MTERSDPNYIKIKKNFNSIVNKAKKTHYISICKEINSEYRHNSSEHWKLMKRLNNCEGNDPIVKAKHPDTGKLTIDPIKILEIFRLFYKTLFQSDEIIIQDNEALDIELHKLIELDEIKLNTLNTTKVTNMMHVLIDKTNQMIHNNHTGNDEKIDNHHIILDNQHIDTYLSTKNGIIYFNTKLPDGTHLIHTFEENKIWKKNKNR